MNVSWDKKAINASKTESTSNKKKKIRTMNVSFDEKLNVKVQKASAKVTKPPKIDEMNVSW
jgi:hypothetical protein